MKFNVDVTDTNFSRNGLHHCRQGVLGNGPLSPWGINRAQNAKDETSFFPFPLPTWTMVSEN